jgi:hypothetical protein
MQRFDETTKVGKRGLEVQLKAGVGGTSACLGGE